MTDDAASQPSTQTDWDLVREAIELFASAIALAWKDPAFSTAQDLNPFRKTGWKLTTTALEESAAKRLPQTGFLVRGVDGTKVAIDSREEVVTVRQALRAAGSYFSDEPFAKRVRETQAFLRYAVGKSRPLVRAIRLYAYGPDGAWKLEEVEKSPNQILAPYTLEAAQVEDLVASVLEGRGITVDHLTALRFEDAASIAADTISALQGALNAPYFGFAVIALLNGPSIDSKEWVAIDGNWYDRPFRVVVGYPSDEMCSAVISRVGNDNALFVPNHLGSLNCYVRLEYEVPASISPHAQRPRDESSKLRANAHKSAIRGLHSRAGVRRLWSGRFRAACQ